MRRLVEGGMVQSLPFDKEAGRTKGLSIYDISTFSDASCLIEQSAEAKRRGDYGILFEWDSLSSWTALSLGHPLVNPMLDPNGDMWGLYDDIYKIVDGVAVAQHAASLNWSGLCSAPNGDIYAFASDGDLYKLMGGVFVALETGLTGWNVVGASPNGDIYASPTASGNAGIYKQTGGVGLFNLQTSPEHSWTSFLFAPNGDVYALSGDDDIYKQIGGSGNFTALDTGSSSWTSGTVTPNGDIYALSQGVDLYIQEHGTSTFVAIGLETGDYGPSIVSTSGGDVYITRSGYDIYKRSNGSASFVPLSAGVRSWSNLAVGPDDAVYANGETGVIYKQADLVSPHNYMSQVVGGIPDLFFRFYFQLDASFEIPDSMGGQGIYLASIAEESSDDLVSVYIDRNGSSYEINFRHGSWNETEAPIGAPRVPIIRSTWYCIDLRFKKNETAGGSEAWLDGTRLYSDMSKNSSAVTPSRWIIGSYYTSFDSVLPSVGAKLFISDVAVDSVGPIGFTIEEGDGSSSASFGAYAKQIILKTFFKKETFYRPDHLYLALMEAEPSDIYEGIEISGGGYARVECDGWSFVDEYDLKLSNASDLLFPIATSDWTGAIAIALYDRASGLRTCYAHAPIIPSAPLTLPVLCHAGDQQLKIPAGHLLIGFNA